MKLLYLLVLLSLLSSLVGCPPVNTPDPTPAPPTSTSTPQSPVGAFESGEYQNMFKDGTPLSSDHSTSLVAMAAVTALAADPEVGKPFVQELWEQ